METRYSLKDFDYTLPPELLARYPLPNRDQSRMMIVDRRQGAIRHAMFSDLPDYLQPGDTVAMNNARVIPARLHGHKPGSSGKVELFLMHPENAERTRWQVLMRPARRLKPGTEVILAESPSVRAAILQRLEGGRGIIELAWPAGLSFDTMLETIGTLPIPPYLEREVEAIDQERYQTVFAKVSGAQAAPTAGLHFTPTILAQLQQQGVGLAELTLHVSAGTFRPVLSDEIADHRMDPEYYEVPETAIAALRRSKTSGGRVLAVGTTTLKTLETVAQKYHGRLQPDQGWSELFITPGFDFKATDALLTNFHLPKSTLLMLVSAFAGHDLIMRAYAEAIRKQYRFYSYGDCMLIL